MSMYPRRVVEKRGALLESLEPRQLLSAVWEGESIFAAHESDWLVLKNIPVPAGGLGVSTGLGDVDGDGTPDFAIAGSAADSHAVFVYSGKTGGLLRTVTDEFIESVRSLANAGDVNGDGIPDMAVGSPLFDPAASVIDRHGCVAIYSGADGGRLLAVTGTGALDALGTRVYGIGDLDGDGAGDLVVSAPGAGPQAEGQVYVMSGASGAVLRTFAGEVPGHRFGAALAVADIPLSDADGEVGDGVPDIVVGAARLQPEGRTDGAVYLFDGATGALRWRVRGADLDPVTPSLGLAVRVVRESGRTTIAADARPFSETLRFRIARSGAVLGSGPVHTPDRGNGLGDINSDGKTDYYRGVPGGFFIVGSELMFYTDAPFAGQSNSGNFVFLGAAFLEYFVERPEWVLIDGHLRPMIEVPGVGTDGLILAANDHGMLAGKIIRTGERFLVIDGVRVMLTDAIKTTVAPPGVTRGAIVFTGIGNDGTVLMNESGRPEGSGDVWALKDGVLTYLWTGYGADINVHGDIVGDSSNNFGRHAMVRWAADGIVQSVEGLHSAYQINTRRDIVGEAPDVPNQWGARYLTPSIWQHGVITPLVRSAKNTHGLNSSWTVYGLSDAGQVLLQLNHGEYGGRLWHLTQTPYLFDPRTGLRQVDEQLRGLLGVDDWNFDGRLYGNGDVARPSPASVLRAQRFATEPAEGAPFSIGATDDATFMVVPTASGDSAVALRVNGYWTVVNDTDLRAALGVEPGQAVEIRGVHTYVNPRTGRAEALIIGARQTALVRQRTDFVGSSFYFSAAVPEFEVFTASVDAPLASAGAVFMADGRVHVAARTAEGRLVVLYEVPDSGPGSIDGYTWVHTDLSGLVEAGGQDSVPVAGTPTAFVMPWGAMNIAYLDEAGDVQVVWWTPGLPSWRIDNLSVITDAPALHGTLVSYITPWNGQNVVATDSDGHLVALWWAPGMEEWRAERLVEGTPARLDENSITAYVTPWGGLNIAGLDKVTGKLTAYWWTPGKPGWIVEEFSIRDAPDDLRLKGRVTAAVSPDGRMFIGALTDDNHLVNIWLGADTDYTWAFEDVTMSV